MSPRIPIERFENELKELIKEWERFFAGVVRVPPEKKRIAFGQKLRRLTEGGGVAGGDAFRLQQLQHKFSTYSTMWERMLREREEGRGRSIAHMRAASRAASLRDVKPPPPDAAGGRSVQQESGGGLYEQFVDAKKSLGQHSSLKREAFQAQLESQREQLEARLGHKVRFEVVVDGDKVKLTAKKNGG